MSRAAPQRARTGALPSSLARALRRPEVRTDLLQAAKAVVATVLAWLLAEQWLGLAQPFLAPWAALLTVHATVYRTVRRGVESVLATFLGITLSFAAVQLLGYGALSLGVAVLVGLLASRVGVLRDEGVTIATTALFVLTAGFASQEDLLLFRFADTILGVVVGLVVNLLVVPPLDDGLADQQLDRVTTRMGHLLQRISEELSLPASHDHARAWIEETRALDRDLDRAEELLRFSQESHWWNVRRRSARATDTAHGEALLLRLEEGVAQTRAIARTVGESVDSAAEWEPRFRDGWLTLLADVGARTADPEAEVGGLRERADELVAELSGEDLPGLHWPVYGSLLNSLLVVITVVDDVGSTRGEAPHRTP